MRHLSFIFLSIPLLLTGTYTTQASFTDVPKTHNSYIPISYLEGKGLITGYADKTFRPRQDISRGEYMTMIHTTLGRPKFTLQSSPFSDLRAEWYKPSIFWGVEQGFIQGKSKDQFMPDSTITLGEGLKIALHAFQQLPEGKAQGSEHWGTPYLEKAAKIGLTTQLRDDTLDSLLQRQDAARIFHFLLSLQELQQAVASSPLTGSSGIIKTTSGISHTGANDETTLFVIPKTGDLQNVSLNSSQTKSTQPLTQNTTQQSISSANKQNNTTGLYLWIEEYITKHDLRALLGKPTFSYFKQEQAQWVLEFEHGIFTYTLSEPEVTWKK